jgi:predicted RNase H-like nuclease (RuvC/YqgF family)
MDKKTLKQEIAKLLKKEMSTTGTGASVTPGVGAGVATKYAFGKRDNKGTPKDWKPAPSIPNRKSKAIDYKQLFEKDEDEITRLQKIADDTSKMPKERDEAREKMYALKKELNEGYAQFKNSTKTRTKPEQYHSAVKEVKKKVNEINRLFEYMDRLKSELNEGEEVKYKKYTEKAIQQIKEQTKSLFFKSTKLK